MFGFPGSRSSFCIASKPITSIRFSTPWRRRPVPERLALCKIEDWDHITAQMHFGAGFPDIPMWNEVPFFRGQKKIVLRNCGLINPDDIEEYHRDRRIQSLYKVLIDGTPELANEQLKISRLRGRGGAGFSTGLKWEFMRKAEADAQIPDLQRRRRRSRRLYESQRTRGRSHSLIEGMAIGGYITGAKQGIIYVRAEYPLAVHRLKVALAQAKNYGVIGDDILGRGYKFDIDLVEGAGAFVCGKETALIEFARRALPAGRGRARPSPPRRACGVIRPTSTTSKPGSTSPPIVAKGPAWFTETGSVASAGTKVFSLVGKVKNTGLVEMPFGTPLSTMRIEWQWKWQWWWFGWRWIAKRSRADISRCNATCSTMMIQPHLCDFFLSHLA